jgi:hypothetical protein
MNCLTDAVALTDTMKKAFEGTLSKSAPDELHAFWDSLPGEGQPAPALAQAAAYGNSLAPAAKTKIAVTNPAKWAAESLALAKRDAYAAPIGASPKPVGGTSYLITTTYYNKAVRDAKNRVALAGARLAKLLNENLK